MLIVEHESHSTSLTQQPSQSRSNVISKFIIFDADNSLAAIGGIPGATQLSGTAPIRITSGIMQVSAYIGDLFQMVTSKEKHPMFERPIETTTLVAKQLAKDAQLKGIVIDTISHTFRQDMRILEKANKSTAMEMADWGKLERMYNGFIATLVSLPCWVIVNCHISYDKDQASGMFYYTPGLKGSTKDTLADYFDLALYTKASRDGKKRYTWQTSADSSKFAKDRLNVLEPIVEQDFSKILSVYREKGHPYPKILVCGESGTGKTKALSTISNTIKESDASSKQ